MACSICRDPTHNRAKCREDLKLLHQIWEMERQHARSRHRDFLRGPPEDWHPDLEVYLDDDSDELAEDERERAAEMAALLQAWQAAGGVLGGDGKPPTNPRPYKPYPPYTERW